jgi:Icc protein
MNIAQLTDLHLCQGKSWDVDVPARLTRVLDDMAGQKIDLIVLTGDLVQTEKDEASYVSVKRALDETRLPYRIAPGNHDDRALLSRIFGLPLSPSGEIYSAKIFHDRELIFLDSSQSVFSDDQWSWLVGRIASAAAEPILFLHHPPSPAGVPVMDRDWRFLQADRFRAEIAAPGKPLTVFCGHYHTEKTVRLPRLDMFICPAVIFQFDPTDTEFKVGSLRFGWRKIEIEDGRLATSVRWFDP